MAIRLNIKKPSCRMVQRMVGLPREMWDIIDQIVFGSRVTGDHEGCTHHDAVFALVGIGLQAIQEASDDLTPTQDLDIAVNPDASNDIRVADTKGENPGEVIARIAAEEEVQEAKERRKDDAKRGKKSKKSYG